MNANVLPLAIIPLGQLTMKLAVRCGIMVIMLSSKSTVGYNWGSKVSVSQKQIQIAEVIKPLITGLTEDEFNAIVTCLKEQIVFSDAVVTSDWGKRVY